LPPGPNIRSDSLLTQPAKNWASPFAGEGKGVEEKGIDEHTSNIIVAVDPRYFRPTEVETLLGDPTKAKERLGWLPRTPFNELVSEMVVEDLKEAERDQLCHREGFTVLKRFE